jgi:hypothetical protein
MESNVKVEAGPVVMMCSRRTIMSGEVVTFATRFEHKPGMPGGYQHYGPFEVSASRDAVMVHRAECHHPDDVALLIQAIRAAGRAMENLRPTRSGGHASKYPSVPTPIPGEEVRP